MPKKTKDDVVSRKKQILATAQRCFSRYGFAKTTLDDIAKGVGMKKASLYYYYENKEAIFRNVIDLETDGLIDALRRAVAQQSSAEDKLFAFGKAQLDFFRQYINLHELSVNIVLEIRPLIDKLYQNFRQRQVEILIEIITVGIQTGEFKKYETRKTADGILTVLETVKFKEFQNTTVYAASDIDYAKIESEVNFILNIVLHGIMQ